MAVPDEDTLFGESRTEWCDIVGKGQEEKIRIGGMNREREGAKGRDEPFPFCPDPGPGLFELVIPAECPDRKLLGDRVDTPGRAYGLHPFDEIRVPESVPKPYSRN